MPHPFKKHAFSIRTRITLYTTLLVFLSCCVLLALFLTGAKQTACAYDENLLLEAMASAADTVSYKNNLPAMEAYQAVDFGRVSFVLFDASGSLWQGQWPPFTLPFEDGRVQIVTTEQDITYLSQDWALPFPEGNLWLRGYIAVDSMGFLRHTSAQIMILFLLLMILLCAIGGLFITHSAFAPIAAMARQAERIAGGHDLTQRFDTGHSDHPDEIGQLALTFNHMFERLNASFERERQFTDDASHELRTPVAVISSACGYALSQEDPEEYKEALCIIRDKAQSMSSMLSQLLQLARMDAGRTVLVRESVDLSRLCRETARELTRAHGCTLHLEGISDGAVLQGDELLLIRAVSNLLDNALRYARTQVCISLAQEDGMLTLRIRDDGPGMAPEVAAQAFTRFYQAAPDRSGQGSGAGLGLPMARAICQLHGGSLVIEQTDESGTTLTARLPVHSL